MKKLLLLAAMTCLAFAGFAQGYYVLEFPNAGTNPGGLNTLDEAPQGSGLAASWFTIHEGGATSPEWSPIQNVPFPFQFNGEKVDQFRVSTSGILTFSSVFTPAPSSVNQELPSTSIPPKSICLWGLSGNNTNDKIVTQVFGSSPNRQLWVMFTNYGYEGGIVTCNTYWSIVLEETSQNIFVVDQRTTAIGTCTPELTVGIQLKDGEAVMVNGSPAVSNQAGDDPSPSDNSYYQFVPGPQPKNDLKALELDIQDALLLTDAPFVIKGKFVSLGADPVQSFDLVYTINGGPDRSHHFSGTISPIDLQDLTHKIAWKPSTPGTYEIRLKTVVPNGFADEDPTNDQIMKVVQVVESPPGRLALVEVFTQHNCGPCASQNPALDSKIQANPEKFAAIKYSGWWPGANDDHRYLFNQADNDTRIGYYSVNGVPTTIFAGTWDGSPAGVTNTMIDDEIAIPGLFDVQISETVSGGNIDVSVDITPLNEVDPEMVTAQVVVIQDELLFPTPTGTNGEKDFYEVMRYMIPNANGTQITSDIGVTSNISGTVAIDPIFEESMIRVVVFVQNDATKEIYMATKSDGKFFCPGGGIMEATTAITDASCSGTGGAITVTPSGGAGGYSYSWSTGDNTATIDNQAPGTYYVDITDAGGCHFTLPVIIGQKSAPNVHLASETTSCNGEQDGSIKVVINGGTAPYTYDWSNGSTTKNVNNLAPGNYTLTLTDDGGCITTHSIDVQEPNVLGATASQVSPNNGTYNGVATTDVTGGTHPYTYKWNTSPFQYNQSATGLGDGTYEVTITDYRGCKTTASVSVDANVGIEDLEAAGINSLEVFPNPSNGIFTLDMELAKLDDIQIAVTDIAGKIVFADTQSKTLRYTQEVDLSEIANGVYVLQIRTSTGVGYKRIVLE